MKDVIHLLPDHVANQIAAGEVVQRPASVVKELLENSIDAGAGKIRVIVKEAGKTLLQVIDDGRGMSEKDARLCFGRHTTSKISSAEDLFNLHTKGFRGEALASIAAISHVELKTRQAGDETGNLIKIEGSEITSEEACVTPIGTSVSVKNLFFNIPARRNFLKSDTVENRHVIDEFQRVALAHPDIEFSLLQNGSEIFQLPKGNYRQRIVNIFGGKTNEKLVPVKEETELVRISGFVGKPEFAKRSRGEQFFFVNGRYIRNSYLNHSVLSSFEGLLREKTHPSYFLFLEVDPRSIDINIHPTKTEIKFDDEQSLYAILRSAIKHSLGQFNVAPVLDFDRDSSLDTPYGFSGKPVLPPKVEVDRDFNPFRDQNGQMNFRSANKPSSAGSWEALYNGFENPDSSGHFEMESDGVSEKLFQDEDADDSGNTTFQLNKKYIISSLKGGILVIDQHRAHSRIIYEELLKNITLTAAVSQQLLFPLKLQFSSDELALLRQSRESLENTGFVFSEFSMDSVEITGIPTEITESEVAFLLDQLISDLQNEIPGEGFSQADLLSKSLSGGMAVKSGTILNNLEQKNIVNRLFACKESALTPHNKPIFITLTVDELDKKFL